MERDHASSARCLESAGLARLLTKYTGSAYSAALHRMPSALHPGIRSVFSLALLLCSRAAACSMPTLARIVTDRSHNTCLERGVEGGAESKVMLCLAA